MVLVPTFLVEIDYDTFGNRGKTVGGWPRSWAYCQHKNLVGLAIAHENSKN
ncbi:hypothetical protein [Picosynechococcus sp. PCC 11901]|uniref:hypothetical protein n=1 Tax=Picosynechococcus sp. PCC 11901 TaxID=2579791 RepID=UPI0030DD3BED